MQKCGLPQIRKKYGHTCKNCERDNHYESVCRSNTSKPKVKQNEESESAVFDSLCAATVSPLGKRTIQLDHHLYSQMYNTWIKRPSQPQPFINIVVKVVEDDYKQLGFQNSLVSQQRSTVIPAMADTGCQSCLAEIKGYDDVKASLDHDVMLGVIEPVPVGEPVTWFHRMVICSKKNGQSRRTVDFQSFNAPAIREHVKHNPLFIRQDQFLEARKRLYLTLGMVTIVYPSEKKTDILPPLSLHGEDTCIRLHLKIHRIR
ncbi:unnamed protein product [Mytilus edulis]|uniref:Uncharacterized protein n=1 Tax=Mytilus edulis TaxID=6550 RepID=A0A8S3STZ5_MYTED|nr:unnamed protein product [Mytilus edulis]